MAAIKNISTAERTIGKIKIKPGDSIECNNELAREFQDDPVFQVTLGDEGTKAQRQKGTKDKE